MVEHVVGDPMDTCVLAVGSELAEEDHLPKRAGVLGGVAAERIHPVSLVLHRFEDRTHGRMPHGGSPRGADLAVVGRRAQKVAQREEPDARVARFEQPIQDGVLSDGHINPTPYIASGARACGKRGRSCSRAA